MQDYPPIADQGRREPAAHDHERHQTHDSGASLWIAAATVIISLAVLLMFTPEKLHNGGAPFVITPPGQISALPHDSR